MPDERANAEERKARIERRMEELRRRPAQPAKASLPVHDATPIESRPVKERRKHRTQAELRAAREELERLWNALVAYRSSR
jgi:RNA processing factor Prp31